ncbi:MAG: FMN-binding negative transcriptional regulator, partial [Actinomycetota bacterium]|nr:FMN-binding negative transcriptional regulator [Actinomycetota bacterium]
MRHNPAHAETDEAVVRKLIEANPWATLISRDDADTLVASHYPILLDPDADGLAVVTHVGRPDERVHGFGDREILLIVATPCRPPRLARAGGRGATGPRHGGHPAGDHAVCLQGQDEPGQGSAVPAPGARRPARAGPVCQPAARRRDG